MTRWLSYVGCGLILLTLILAWWSIELIDLWYETLDSEYSIRQESESFLKTNTACGNFHLERRSGVEHLCHTHQQNVRLPFFLSHFRHFIRQLIYNLTLQEWFEHYKYHFLWIIPLVNFWLYYLLTYLILPGFQFLLAKPSPIPSSPTASIYYLEDPDAIKSSQLTTIKSRFRSTYQKLPTHATRWDEEAPMNYYDFLIENNNGNSKHD